MHQLKGSSSRFVSQEFGIPFDWQKGYGVFGVSDRLIDTVKAYVLRQKQHHARQTIIGAWEETHDWNLGPEEIAQTDDAFWQQQE
ncbi:MAG: hypothetical protein R2867_45485 [Caldilineaceae bacterium]